MFSVASLLTRCYNPLDKLSYGRVEIFMLEDFDLLSEIVEISPIASGLGVGIRHYLIESMQMGGVYVGGN
jgi:hypothetical protein